MITSPPRVSCRPLLLIFVNRDGQDIFQQLAVIQQQIALDVLVQQYTGVIFYRSRLRKAWAGPLNADAPFGDPGLYRVSLAEAVAGQLDQLLQNEVLVQRLIGHGFDVQRDPHLVIVGSAQTPAPDLVLRQVQAVLARYAQTLPAAHISCVYTGRADASPAQTTEDKTPDERIAFQYLYRHLSPASSRQQAVSAAACALLMLINTDISGRQEFWQATQRFEQRRGRLSTCFLTFPGQLLRRYLVTSMASDLVNEWLRENGPGQPGAGPTPVQSPGYARQEWVKNLAERSAVHVTRQLEMKAHTVTALDRHFTPAAVNTANIKPDRQQQQSAPEETPWSTALAKSDVPWVRALVQKAQEAWHEWRTSTEAHIQGEIATLITQDLQTILQEQQDIAHLVLASMYIDVGKKHCETLLRAASGQTDGQHPESADVEPAGQETPERLITRLERPFKQNASPATLLMTLVLALLICWLLFAQSAPFVLSALLVALFLGFFCWQQWQRVLARRQLIGLTRQDTFRQVEQAWREQQQRQVSSLYEQASRQLQHIAAWLAAWQRQLPLQADERLTEALSDLKKFAHTHVCNGRLLLKHDPDRRILREYALTERDIIKHGEHGKRPGANGVQTLWGIRSALYRALFAQAERPEAVVAPGELQSDALATLYLFDPLGSILDRHLWETPELLRSTSSTELTLAGDNPEVWRDIFGLILQPPSPAPGQPALALVCNGTPDVEGMTGTIQRATSFNASDILLLRIPHEDWLFVAALYAEQSTPQTVPPVAEDEIAESFTRHAHNEQDV